MPSSTTLTTLALLSLGQLTTSIALEPRQISSPPVSLVKTSNYLNVVPVKASASKSAATVKGYGSAKLRDLLQGDDWAVKVNFGGEDVYLLLDTGSSDTWVAESGFQCVDGQGAIQPQSACAFGPLYNGTFQKGEISDVSSISL